MINPVVVKVVVVGEVGLGEVVGVVVAAATAE